MSIPAISKLPKLNSDSTLISWLTRNQDLDRATGDQTSQIQAELSAHEASMSQYDKQVEGGRWQTSRLSLQNAMERWHPV